MDEVIWKIFQTYERSKHYYVDPFPHIYFENALTKEEIHHGIQNFQKAEEWKSNYRGGPWRHDYVNITKDNNFHTEYFHKLAKEFDFNYFEGMEVERIVSKRQQSKATRNIHARAADISSKPWVESQSVFSVYNQELMTDPEKYKLENEGNRIAAVLPHHDLPEKVFVTLLYYAHENDGQGGDLNLYYGLPNKRGHGNITESMDNVKKWKTIKYAPGNMIIFPNGPAAFHAISQRRPGPFNRYIAYLTYNTNHPKWIRRWKF